MKDYFRLIKLRLFIYSTMLKSFGILLLETKKSWIPILASELDYIYDLPDPEEFLNQSSTILIARSIVKCQNISENYLEK